MARPDNYNLAQAQQAADSYRADFAKLANTVSAEKPMTEMEELCARMADTARRLGSAVDRIQGRVDGFMQQGQAIGGSPEVAPEPQPGTLSALRHWQRLTEVHAERLSQVAGNLAGII